MSKKNTINLRKVTVRPVTKAEEIFRWNKLVKEQHYLKSSHMIGEQIRYVAEYNGIWLACLGVSSGVLKSKLRSDWIEWSSLQEKQRLHLVVQNARFLILKSISVPNLASRCLSLLTKRVSFDWMEHYGHPVYLMETFVDSDRTGACYKASGWTELGMTAGFRREVEGYSRHGVKKSYWVYPLRKSARDLLGGSKTSDDKPIKLLPKDLPLVDKQGIPNIHNILEKYFPDDKNKKKNGAPYKLSVTMGLVLTGFVCGVEDAENIAAWAKELDEKYRIALGCPYRKHKGKYGYQVPCANTIRYALQDIDSQVLEKAMQEWAVQCGINTSNTVLALDGKVLRGAKTEEERAPTHVTLYDVNSGTVLDQELVPNKTNEVPVARDIFSRNNLSNSLVTADAAHTNPKTSDTIKKTAIFCSQSKKINLHFFLP